MADFEKLIKKYGSYNFNFELTTQSNYVYLASNLVATATNNDGIPIATWCEWYRIWGNWVYKLSGISGNIYQISAEDVGCWIIVEVSPIDEDEGYEGVAKAEFGPVEMEPNSK